MDPQGPIGRREPREVPDPRERRFSIERDVLKLALQHPRVTAEHLGDLEPADFTHPYYQEMFAAITDRGGPEAVTADDVASAVPEDCRSTVSALSVEPLQMAAEPDSRLVSAYVVRLRELTALRRIAQVKARLQRMNPVNETAEYNRLFGELVALESHRRALREEAIGSGV